MVNISLDFLIFLLLIITQHMNFSVFLSFPEKIATWVLRLYATYGSLLYSWYLACLTYGMLGFQLDKEISDEHDAKIFAGFIVLGREKKYILNRKEWKQQL